MKLRRNKKGFTIIELVIVIAVIGILAAILIPTFVNLTNKANEASDNALVNNLNKALKMEEQEPGHKKAETLEGAIIDLEKQGYILENLASKSGKDLLWSQSQNQFLLNTESKSGKDYWKIVDAVPDNLDNQKYSYYAGKNFNQTDVPAVKYGFDAGRNYGITKVTYQGTGTAQEVAIRTNSFATTLTIKAPVDTVKHYGNAAIVKVEEIAPASYHENGTVGRLSVESGHAVAEPEAIIFCFNNIGADESTPSTVEVKSGATVYNNAGEAAGLEAVNTTSTTFKDDCGAGGHDFGSQLVIDNHVYEVCKSCGYTLVTVVDLSGNESKTTMVDNDGEIVTTPIETYNSTATNNAGQVVENKEEPVVETPAVSNHTDVTCNHNFVVTVSIEATCTQTGVKTFKCSICGASFTSNIPMKAHSYYDHAGAAHTSDEECSVCGHVRGDYVAEINGTKYTTLTDAIAAVPANTQTLITLINDDAIEGNAGWTIATDKNIVLDLNGYTLKNLVTTNAHSAVISNLGKLVIKDSTDLNKNGTGTGKIFNQLKQGFAVGGLWPTYNFYTDVLNNNGDLTVNSGWISVEVDSGISYAIDTLTNGGSYTPNVTINGGRFTTSKDCKSTVIRMFCNSTTKLNLLTINGGYFERGNGSTVIWMQNPNSSMNKGSLVINGGIFVPSYGLNESSSTISAGSSTNMSVELNGGIRVGGIDIGNQTTCSEDNMQIVTGDNALHYNENGEYSVVKALYKVTLVTHYQAVTSNYNEYPELYVDIWSFWGAKGYKDANGNECEQYVLISDTTVYDCEAGNDAISGKNAYDNYLAPGKGYEGKYLYEKRDVTKLYYFDSLTQANEFSAIFGGNVSTK